jgi:hypothetical protein
MLAALSIAATMPLAQAARLVPDTGEILLNSGSGYQPSAGVMELKPGDAVIVKPDAKASLIYGDGCAVAVVPGMVAWVEPTSPCQEKSGRTRDPDPTLTTPRVFDPTWLIDGAALLKRNRNPAGP